MLTTNEPLFTTSGPLLMLLPLPEGLCSSLILTLSFIRRECVYYVAETILVLLEMAMVVDCKKDHKSFPSLTLPALLFWLGSAMWLALANGILVNVMQAKAWRVLVLFQFLSEIFCLCANEPGGAWEILWNRDDGSDKGPRPVSPKRTPCVFTDDWMSPNCQPQNPVLNKESF